jgi:hypothetical protein
MIDEINDRLKEMIMNKIKLLLVAILILTTSNISIAADRSEQGKQLMNVLGFSDILESQRSSAAKMVEDQMNVIITQLQKSIPNMPETVITEFRVAAQKFGSRIMNSWNSTEATKIYSSALIEGFSEDEISAAIAHYKTPQGKKELKIINEAVAKLNRYLMGSIQKETELAMKDFLNELKIIVDREKRKQLKSKSTNDQ